MRRVIATTTAGLWIIAEAAAQAPPEERSELRFELSPALGESLRDTTGNQPVDESEALVAARLLRPVSRTLEIQALPALAWSPQYYDDADPSSQLRVGLELRRRDRVAAGARPVRYANIAPTIAQWFVRYSPSLGFDDFLGGHRFFDNGFAGGVRFANDMWFNCRRRWIIAAGLGCGERRIAIELTPLLQYTVSDQSRRRRLTPQVDARIVAPIRNVNLVVTSRYENRRFSDLRAPDGARQRDGRLTIGASIDFVPAIKAFQRDRYGKRPIVNDFTLEIGARYVRNRSNAPGGDFDRVFFVPKITYSRQLD